MTLLAITAHNGIRLAEVGFLLIGIAGVWMFLAQVLPGFHTFRNAVAGLCLGAAGALLIIATHWGHFG
jgi:uncharacterized membrane protein YuzA (DUF378 family)